MSRYWIIDTEQTGSTKEAIGPFKSAASAEKWLVTYHAELFDGSFVEGLGEHHNWSGSMLIVQLVKTVQPVPVVSAKIKLKDVKEGAK